MTHKLRINDRVYHRGRREYGTYGGLTADSATVWVRFDDSADDEKVSRDQLSKVTANRQEIH